MRGLWLAGASIIQRRYVWVLAVSVAATVAFAFGIPRLEFKTSQDTLVPSDSTVFRQNQIYQQQFGGEPMLILFEGDIRLLFNDSDNVRELTALEAELNASDAYHSVFGPITLLEFAARQVTVGAELAPGALQRNQDAAAQAARDDASTAGATPAAQAAAAEAARERVAQEFFASTAVDAERLIGAGAQSLANSAFVDFLLFDETGDVRSQLQGAFPDPQHALMVVRLNGNMTFDEQGEAAADVVALVEARRFEGFDVLATGPPILLKEINDTMRESIAIMAVLAVLIMAVVLFLVFRARWRLLSLGVVLVGSVWAFGLMGYLGIPLTMVTISGLPILIGLGVDFAIQMHSRFEEESERAGSAAAGLPRALTKLGPALTAAVLAATLGFLVLHISRVPMIRDFGSMLAVGIVILFIAGLAIPASILFWRDRNRTTTGPSPSSRLEVERVVRVLATSADGRLLPLLLVGAAFVFVGFVVDQRINIQTDPERFVPQDSQVLQDLYTIRDAAGSSSELGILVEADDVTRPDVLAWMADFEQRQLERHPAELLSSNSIATIATQVTGATPIPGDIEAILSPSIAPPAIRNSFLSEDHTRANIIFQIGPVSLDEQRDLIEEMQADLGAPDGVTATPAGLAVIGIEAVDALGANRTLMTYAALAAVLAWLLVTYRNIVKAVLPLLPVLIAVGGSSAAIYMLGIELNPLTAVSGPLIIATCTEFSVLIMARYFEEREAGHNPREAMGIASVRIGQAIAASGLTTIGGFGVLAFSGFPLLESFGVVTALNVGIALLSALVVLPPLLVWADQETHLVPISEDLRTAE